MDNETLKAKATELYESGMGYIKIASELGIDRDKVRRLLGRKHRNSENRFKPSKLHVPLELRLINILADTQMRVSIDDSTVEEYAEAMAEGIEFPSVAVFTNGLLYWLADGFHRYYAARAAAVETIAADIYQGTLRDAQLYAMGANASHGLRRTNADKRHTVEVALDDKEWCELSNTEIARMCAVAESFVRKVKQERDTAAQNSHNASPSEMPDERFPDEDHERAKNEPSVSEHPDVQKKTDTPQHLEKSPGAPQIQGYTVSHSKDQLTIEPADGKQFKFNSKQDLEDFINGLQRLLNFWRAE